MKGHQILFVLQCMLTFAGAGGGVCAMKYHLVAMGTNHASCLWRSQHGAVGRLARWRAVPCSKLTVIFCSTPLYVWASMRAIVRSVVS